MNYVLVLILAIASTPASAEVQTWLIATGVFQDNIIGEFSYDSKSQKITDWAINAHIDGAEFLDPFNHFGPIGGPVEMFFAPSRFKDKCGDLLCNSADILSPTELRFTTGTSAMSLATLDIKLFSPFPDVQPGGVSGDPSGLWAPADMDVSLFNGSPWCRSGCRVGGMLVNLTAAVPEPSSIAFLGMGVALVIFQRILRYRRFKV